MNSDRIILLHGLILFPATLAFLERYLERKGYEVLNIGYPSRKHGIDHLVAHYIAPQVMEFCDDAPGKIHFVTHSMGSIITRRLLQCYAIPTLGRVVMLAPPNQGSPMANFFSRFDFAKKILGPALGELTTHDCSFVKQLGPIQDFECGIITGNQNIIPLSSRVMPSPHDGLVSVEHAKIEGMKELLVKNTTHGTMIFNLKVFRQIVYFLNHGHFKD